MINEMLVTEDKYETYRLGYKRGHDRGYEFAKQQDREELLDLKANNIILSDQVEELKTRRVINQ